MREMFDVLALAVLQGIAEFLPISSSGHLVIAQDLLHVNNPGVRLEVVLHLGTMVSILIYYRRVLADLIGGLLRGTRASWTMAGHILLSAIPAAVFYFCFQHRVDACFESVRAIGGFLMFTGVVLVGLRWLKCGNGGLTAWRAIMIGLAQAVAILPGVSRSGMTIAAARASGVAPDRAAEFSFLMCLPLLAGAAALDALGVPKDACTLPAWLLLAGALVSAAVGVLALSVLVRALRGGRFWLFGVYCLAVGALALAFG